MRRSSVAFLVYTGVVAVVLAIVGGSYGYFWNTPAEVYVRGAFGILFVSPLLVYLADVVRRNYVGMRAHSRRMRGHCGVCDYDLSQHQPGDRCPECGTPV